MIKANSQPNLINDIFTNFIGHTLPMYYILIPGIQYSEILPPYYHDLTE